MHVKPESFEDSLKTVQLIEARNNSHLVNVLTIENECEINKISTIPISKKVYRYTMHNANILRVIIFGNLI